MEHYGIERRTMMAAIGGAAGLLLVPSAATPAQPNRSFPRPGWALEGDKAAVLSNGPAIASPLDMLMIQQLFGRYGMAYDHAQADVLHSLFTQDAVVDLAKGSTTPFATVSGLAAIVKNFTGAAAQQGDQRRHCFTNILVETVSSEGATALAYGLVTVAADGLSLGTTVVYTARLSKQAEIWKFQYLFIGMDDYVGPAPRVEM